MRNGTTDATTGQAVAGYNVPIVSLNLGTRDTYTVKMSHVISVAGESAAAVNLDGFRVYGTIAEDDTYYVSDKEDNPSYIEVRSQVLAGLGIASSEDSTAQVGAVLPADSQAAVIANSEKYTAANVQDLLDNGPKNEVYLQPDQALVFKITTDREVQIGLKALNTAASFTVNGEAKNISSSTDMFYTVLEKNSAGTNTITITNTGAGILAVTKLKVCDDPNASLGILTAEDLGEALAELGIAEDKEPEAAYGDAVLTVKVNGAVTALTKNGIIGESAVFTADEIKAAAAELAADGYEIKEASYSDISVAYGESGQVTFTAEKKTEVKPDTGSNASFVNALNKILSSIKKFLKK